jgi:hypothetical protein
VTDQLSSNNSGTGDDSDIWIYLGHSRDGKVNGLVGWKPAALSGPTGGRRAWIAFGFKLITSTN